VKDQGYLIPGTGFACSGSSHVTPVRLCPASGEISPVMCRKRGDSRPESLDLGTPPSLSSHNNGQKVLSESVRCVIWIQTTEEICDYCLSTAALSPLVGPRHPQTMMRISEIIGAHDALHDRFDRWAAVLRSRDRNVSLHVRLI
jgi:hypothetical protein